MKHRQSELRESCRRLDAFALLADKAGRPDDAAALRVGSDVCGLCADHFGLSDSPIRRSEDRADAARARSHLAGLMTPAQADAANAECCPYTLEGVCPDCQVFRGTFTVQGGRRVYVCLTKWTSRR